jgi:hypothetical protein
MGADEILHLLESTNEPPSGWVVFPLLRHKMIVSIWGWIGGTLMGGLLIAFVIPIVTPTNYEHGVAAIITTTLMLALAGFIFFGSLGLLIYDSRRLCEIDKHIIVITNEDFVKQEGEKIIHVPLAHVRHVTTRGKRRQAAKLTTEEVQLPRMCDSILGMFSGREASRPTKTSNKRLRTPTSLAFIDTRSGKEVLVVNDTNYGDPFLMAVFLKQHVEAITSR